MVDGVGDERGASKRRNNKEVGRIQHMCGRYTLSVSAAALAEQFAEQFGVAADVPSDLPARYNIAPTQNVIAVRSPAAAPQASSKRQTSPEREAALLRWGLVPAWAKDPSMGARLINARAETVAEKPAFRQAFRERRCLIPATGFYEWQRQESGRKQPFYFRLKSGGVFAFAGLWESWREPGSGEMIQSCTLLTTEANDVLRPVHDRMPVMLHADDYDAWLGERADNEDRARLLRPYPAEEMTAYPVSTHVNKPQHDDQSCVEQLDLEASS